METLFLQKKEYDINCQRGVGKEVKLSNPRDNRKIPGICFSGKKGKGKKGKGKWRQPPAHTSVLLPPVIVVQPFLVVFSCERRKQRAGTKVG